VSRTTEQFTLGNISNVWSNTKKKNLLDVNKKYTVTSALWTINTVPYDVNKPENLRKSHMFTKAAFLVKYYNTNCNDMKYYYNLKLLLKCNLFLWCKATFSALFLQSLASHLPSEITLICCSINIIISDENIIINVKNSSAFLVLNIFMKTKTSLGFFD